MRLKRASKTDLNIKHVLPGSKILETMRPRYTVTKFYVLIVYRASHNISAGYLVQNMSILVKILRCIYKSLSKLTKHNCRQWILFYSFIIYSYLFFMRLFSVKCKMLFMFKLDNFKTFSGKTQLNISESLSERDFIYFRHADNNPLVF